MICFRSKLSFAVIFLLWLSTISACLAHRNTRDLGGGYSPSKHQGKPKKPVEDAAHWFDSAQETLAAKLNSRTVEKQAKNIIFFLGDGMSVSTITAARILKGQVVDNVTFGEETDLFFNTFPHTGVSKTFCSDSQVADSACTATAYLCGIKANMATLGVTSDVSFGDCTAQMNVSNQVQSILAWAQGAGKSTGIVTTTRLTDASPAGTYGHAANRDWENDEVVRRSGADPNICDDLAEQLVLKEPGRRINVILGGGRREFVNESISDVETGEKGNRLDGKNLINSWIIDKIGVSSSYITNRDELLRVNVTSIDYLLGIFSPGDLAYVESQVEEGDPKLEEMTKVAIQILSKNPNGFFLFVEGGKIDNAHHSNHAKRALMETIEFDNAIKIAANMTSEQDTVTLVTSDHSHVMTIGGYPERGNPIFGIGDYSDRDQLPYTTISYANGPGYKENNPDNTRYNISGDPLENLTYRPLAGVPTSYETHGGDDVLIFAKGPFGHLLTGVHQQSYIPHVLAYAACIGPGLQFCDQQNGMSTNEIKMKNSHQNS